MKVPATLVNGYKPQTIDTKKANQDPTEAPDRNCLQQTTE